MQWGPGAEACLPRGVGHIHYLPDRLQKGVSLCPQRRLRSTLGQETLLLQPPYPASPHRTSILDAGSRALSREGVKEGAALGACLGKCGAEGGGLPRKKGRSVAWLGVPDVQMQPALCPFPSHHLLFSS